jgi:hypothetical protein
MRRRIGLLKIFLFWLWLQPGVLLPRGVAVCHSAGGREEPQCAIPQIRLMDGGFEPAVLKPDDVEDLVDGAHRLHLPDFENARHRGAGDGPRNLQ